MKITVETPPVEVEVEINSAQIAAAVQTLAAENAEYFAMDGEPDAVKRHSLRAFINDLWRCFQAINDDMIGLLPDKQRNAMASALRKEAARYATETSIEPPPMPVTKRVIW